MSRQMHDHPSPSTPFTFLRQSGEFELALESDNEGPARSKTKPKRNVSNESRKSATSKKYLGALSREHHAQLIKDPQDYKGTSYEKGWAPERIVEPERCLYGQLVRRGVVSGLVVDS